MENDCTSVPHVSSNSGIKTLLISASQPGTLTYEYSRFVMTIFWTSDLTIPPVCIALLLIVPLAASYRRSFKQAVMKDSAQAKQFLSTLMISNAGHVA